jgi:hypothetical protein
LALQNTLPIGRNPDYQVCVTEQRKARRLLARMDRMEDFAGKWENFDELYGHLPRWELECQRQNFANTYRQLVGVMPDQREFLRQQLEEVLRTGNLSVDAVVTSVRDCISVVASET